MLWDDDNFIGVLNDAREIVVVVLDTSYDVWMYLCLKVLRCVKEKVTTMITIIDYDTMTIGKSRITRDHVFKQDKQHISK